jgi:copper chaperone
MPAGGPARYHGRIPIQERTMISMQVKGMSCGHCVKAVTAAIHEVDPAARVSVTLAEGRVDVDTSADAARVSQAIREAGYEVPASA